MTAPINRILFDLDGTLLDSAKDLHDCLNNVLTAHGKPCVDLSLVQQHLNVGARGLVQIGFQEPLEEKILDQLQQEFLSYYTRLTFTEPAHFFEDTLILLNTLFEKGIAWGIVTNKHERFTRPILENLGLLDKTQVLICGNMVSKGKPSPIPLYMACNHLKIAPDQTCYVGDSLVDMQAAQRAGMPGLLVLWGYWKRLGYSIEGWPYQQKFATPLELLHWIV